MGPDDHATPNPKGPTRDRRTHPRQPHQASLRIHVGHPAGRGLVQVVGGITNLSQGGALVSAVAADGLERIGRFHRIAPGQPCLVEITGGNKDIVPDRVTGTVRRTCLGSQDDFLLGIEFVRPLEAIGDLDDGGRPDSQRTRR